MFHSQLTLLREIFHKKGYPGNFIDRCFKLFLNRTHIVKEKVLKVEKKPLPLVLPYLGNISPQTRTKLQNIPKDYLTVVMYRLFSKFKVNSATIFASKTLFSKLLDQVWFTSVIVDYAMNPISENVFDTLL